MIKYLLLVMCHLIGDYVLQNDFIASTKGSNWYHLFVHSFLYCVPFVFFVSFNYLVLIFVSHFIIDALKARYSKIGYIGDQVLHYVVLICISLLQ